MKRKLFVVSDIHGGYNYLIESLKQVNYDENDSNSILICCGDMFDRLEQSKEVYTYLKGLSDKGKAICLRGNHETFLIDFLEGKDCSFNFMHNGFNKTLDSFLSEQDSWKHFIEIISDQNKNKKDKIKLYGSRVSTIIDEFNSIPSEITFNIFQEYAREKINKEFPELLSWLKSRLYYCETENYIFTHGAIDGLCEDWHNPIYTPYDFWSPWEYLTWDDGNFYKQDIINTNKTVVVGHFHTDAIRERFHIPISGNNSILISEDKRKIFIDTCTVITHKVNVLILEDDLI